MREILVYTGRSAPTGGGVEYAARLCALLESALSALYIHPSPVELMPPFGVPALLGEMIEAAQATEAAAIAAGGSFASAMRALGVEHANWQVAEGHAPSILAHVRDWADLLVLERGAGTAWSTPHELGVIVLHVGMPVIVVPPRVATPRLDRIAIGWNASPEAMRAIHAALPLLQRAAQVVLVAGGASRTAALARGWKPGFDVLGYLHRHGIAAEHVFFDASDEHAGTALLEASARVQADLLVMGAYGRSRLSEWAFGGATRQVLHEASLPVLLHA